MAELVGVLASSVTLAELLKLCIEAFNLVQTVRSQELDLQKLVLRLNIEKCRLYTWGEAMGLTNPPNDRQPSPLDSFEFKPLVLEALQMILRLFSDTSKLQSRYGCREGHVSGTDSKQPHHTDPMTPVEKLSTYFTDFTVGTPRYDTSVKRKAQWLVQDRKKFLTLVGEVRDLVDGLQDMTKSFFSQSRLTQIVSHRVQQIDQIETLQLVSEVCEEEYPVLSDAASMKIDVLSMPQTQLDEIERWKDDVQDMGNPRSAELENLTVTEMQHRLRYYMEQEAHSQNSEPGRSHAHVTAYPPSVDAVMMSQFKCGACSDRFPTEREKSDHCDRRQNICWTCRSVFSCRTLHEGHMRMVHNLQSRSNFDPRYTGGHNAGSPEVSNYPIHSPSQPEVGTPSGTRGPSSTIVIPPIGILQSNLPMRAFTAIPNPEKLQASQIWYGRLLRSGFDDRYLSMRDALSDAAWEGDWSEIFRIVKLGLDHYGENWINCARLKDERGAQDISGWTPLHQAAWLAAPLDVVRRMVALGGFRTLKTRLVKDMSSDNATAYELANWQGNHYLNDILRPPSRHDVPYKAVLRTLQQKFHALIRHDLGNEVDRECLMLPDLAVLTELEKPEMWFPLKDNRVDRPRGYFYRLEELSLWIMRSAVGNGQTETLFAD